MSASPSIPATRVLAVASHVVSGYVGNKIAVFVLQSLGCDVAALNTVQFSNHTGYRQWTGTMASAQEITDLYNGLRQSYLDDFDMMLSGYIPGAEAVAAVGAIAKELKEKTRDAPGKFFWVLDPVMGDNGKIYVAEDVVPAYKSLVPLADLILPNQFEAELLSEVKIADMESLNRAIQALHDKYRIPHVVITSVKFSVPGHPADHLSVVGSSMTSSGKARLFKIVFPSIDCYFCGTGDMFGALITMRMREAVEKVPGLSRRPNWLSDDNTPALELPLAKALEKVLASMHQVLSRTRDGMAAVVERTSAAMTEEDKGDEKKAHFVKTKAAELQLVRNLDCLRTPVVEFMAKAI
ncbi:pyridoxal kinase [Tolypocladium capitatum]|uniref:pyridoxal kinase n=1 Tax=Tolypocladium capitatum TaxID=45235 RepID=A0A2K3QKU9_9HYPO|nr:pyridoxal kinase [Tolypocladium capitatum]